jgi:hypothetical protein
LSDRTCGKNLYIVIERDLIIERDEPNLCHALWVALEFVEREKLSVGMGILLSEHNEMPQPNWKPGNIIPHRSARGLPSVAIGVKKGFAQKFY